MSRRELNAMDELEGNSDPMPERPKVSKRRPKEKRKNKTPEKKKERKMESHHP